jgi:hypothetical protein
MEGVNDCNHYIRKISWNGVLVTNLEVIVANNKDGIIKNRNSKAAVFNGECSILLGIYPKLKGRLEAVVILH